MNRYVNLISDVLPKEKPKVRRRDVYHGCNSSQVEPKWRESWCGLQRGPNGSKFKLSTESGRKVNCKKCLLVVKANK